MVVLIRQATLLTGWMTLLCGIAYPLLVTGIGTVAFHDQATGSRLEHQGKVVGSALIAQPFDGPQWFHPRPSSAGYNGAGSSGSNYGIGHPDFQARLVSNEPADGFTASASGLDPHISPESAAGQAARVAESRRLDPQMVKLLVDQYTERRTFGVLGEPRVNVLLLNRALEDSDGPPVP